MISAYNLFEYAQTAIRDGAYDYLLKPVEAQKVDDLLRCIGDQLVAESPQHSELQELKQRLSETMVVIFSEFRVGPENKARFEPIALMQCLEQAWTEWGEVHTFPLNDLMEDIFLVVTIIRTSPNTRDRRSEIRTRVASLGAEWAKVGQFAWDRTGVPVVMVGSAACLPGGPICKRI
jgi:two-component system response regulator YesN